MCQISIDVPDEVLYDIHMTTKEACNFARQVVAKELYITGNVSIGYCAQIAEMTEEQFIKYLGANKISIYRFDENEFEEELSVAKNHS